nr:hypothetical protein [Tanacetum cinerariifolium]
MLAEAQESSQILDEEQLAFLADPGIPNGQATQTTILNNTAFQNEDLDAYDSYCDDVSTAQAVLMVNLSNYSSDVILEVRHSKPYHHDTDNESVHAMHDFKQKPVVDFTDNEITNFGKRFVPQQELYAEQAFWLQTSHPNTYQSGISPIKIKAPRELLKTRAFSKEYYDSLIAQLKSKSLENADLKGQIQEKVFVTKALQNELRILKGKNMIDNVTTITNATTISRGMFKLDIEPISHRLKNNRDAHEDYLKKTIENTDTLRGLVECARK